MSSPNYRNVDGVSLQHCGTCKAFDEGRCLKHASRAQVGRTCDSWRPNISALRAETTKHMTRQSVSVDDNRDSQRPPRPQVASEAMRALARLRTKSEGYWSTQFEMPTPIKSLSALYANRIPKGDLYRMPESDNSSDGIERDTHVTAFYGLLPTDEIKQQITSIASTVEPFVIQLGQVSLFTTNPDFDVLKVDVDSPELRQLNGMLSKLPNGNTRTTYNPHMTIAYVKKGRGAKYVGDNEFNGRRARVTELQLSNLSYNKTAVPLTKTAAESFTVFKDANGDYRWVAISSNAYRDRDREIVSLKALTNDVSHADKVKEYGPLRFWHMPGVDIGTCDFNMMNGRMLIESGPFNSPFIGERVKQLAPNYQLSIGFRHPPDQPDANGVYHNIRRFERSLVPAGRAANPFTKLHVKEIDMSAEKIKALQTLLGDDVANQIIASSNSTQKQADDLGVAFKASDVDWNDVASDPEALLSAALKNFEAAEAKKMVSTDRRSLVEDDEEDDEAEMPTYKMGDVMSAIEALSGKIDKILVGRTQKEAEGTDAETAVKDAAQAVLAEASGVQNQNIATLQTQVKELTFKLETAVKDLEDAAGQPSAFDAGYRPTGADETTKEGAVPNVESTTVKNGAVSGGMEGLMSFMTGDLS